MTFTSLDGVVPNSTAVAPVKFIPEIVTIVPPLVGPPFGIELPTLSPETDGASS